MELYFRRGRDRNEEDAWDNAVYEVFGRTDLDLLPDTEADPPHPQWLKVDVFMDEYRTQRELSEEKEEKRLFKKMKERVREDI